MTEGRSFCPLTLLIKKNLADSPTKVKRLFFGANYVLPLIWSFYSPNLKIFRFCGMGPFEEKPFRVLQSSHVNTELWP